MLEINLNMYHALALAAVMYWVGKVVTSKVPFFGKFCIPAPLIGGLIFSLANAALYAAGVAVVSFDQTFGTLFMTMFFTSVGFSASIPALIKGGRFVFVMTIMSAVVIVLQNGLGIALMSLMGENPLYGIACGSLSLIGGPGTSAGIGPDLVAAGAVGATEIAIASATFGMVCGSIISGPTARRLIEKDNLRPAKTEKVLEFEGDGSFKTDGGLFVKGFLLMCLAMGVGEWLSAVFTDVLGISFPSYIGGMTMGLVIRNVMEFAHIEFPSNEMDNFGNMALNAFLAMTLCSLKLWILVDLALPMLVTLLCQAVMTAAFCYFILFRGLGKDYDSAVMVAGFLGMAMGTASNGMVSMQVLCDKYGMSLPAYFAVPVAGLFMDFINAALIAANIAILA